MPSEYQRLREANIARNEQFLQTLGLNEVKPKKRAVLKRKHSFSGSEASSVGSSSDDDGSLRRHMKRDQKKALKPVDESLLRRSSRARGKAPEAVGELPSDEEEKWRPSSNYADDDLGRNKVTAKSLRDTISKNRAHDKIISDQAIVHCVDRLNSMSEKALTTRANMIARAAGKNSKEKLMVFSYALKAAGLEEVAVACDDAIARLERK